MVGTGRSGSTVAATVSGSTAAHFRIITGHAVRRGQGHQIGLGLLVAHLFTHQINILVVMIVTVLVHYSIRG